MTSSPFRPQPDEPGTSRFLAVQCPWCGTKLDAASGIGMMAVPSDGDYNLCASCGEPSRFVVNDVTGVSIRRCDEEEYRFARKEHGHLMDAIKDYMTFRPSTENGESPVQGRPPRG